MLSRKMGRLKLKEHISQILFVGCLVDLYTLILPLFFSFCTFKKNSLLQSKDRGNKHKSILSEKCSPLEKRMKRLFKNKQAEVYSFQIH